MNEFRLPGCGDFGIEQELGGIDPRSEMPRTALAAGDPTPTSWTDEGGQRYRGKASLPYSDSRPTWGRAPHTVSLPTNPPASHKNE